MKVLTIQEKILTLIIAVCCFFWVSEKVWAENEATGPAIRTKGADPLRPVMTQAVMCEELQGYAPVNPAIVFSASRQRVFCFTAFDPVPEKTIIYHKWYRRDSLTATVKLQLNPPRWTTFSNMQLRESDKGPWQVKITDADGNVFHILRYSIAD